MEILYPDILKMPQSLLYFHLHACHNCLHTFKDNYLLDEHSYSRSLMNNRLNLFEDIRSSKSKNHYYELLLPKYECQTFYLYRARAFQYIFKQPSMNKRSLMLGISRSLTDY